MYLFTKTHLLFHQHSTWEAELFVREFQSWAQVRGTRILEKFRMQGGETVENHLSLVLLATSVTYGFCPLFSKNHIDPSSDHTGFPQLCYHY